MMRKVTPSSYKHKYLFCVQFNVSIFLDEDYKEDLSGSTAICALIKDKTIYCVSLFYEDFFVITVARDLVLLILRKRITPKRIVNKCLLECCKGPYIFGGLIIRWICLRVMLVTREQC